MGSNKENNIKRVDLFYFAKFYDTICTAPVDNEYIYSKYVKIKNKKIVGL